MKTAIIQKIGPAVIVTARDRLKKVGELGSLC
jgi:hypothetical protein